MSIVTKTGDTGQTDLLGANRVSKANVRLHAIGSVDELDALIGFVCSLENDDVQLVQALHKIQKTLYCLKADLAVPKFRREAAKLKHEDITELEEWIAGAEKDLQPLRYFIIPGGTQIAAQLHLTRTVCRRAERWVVQLGRETPINLIAVRYLNRLSDFLFVAARRVNQQAGVEEERANR